MSAKSGPQLRKVQQLAGSQNGTAAPPAKSPPPLKEPGISGAELMAKEFPPPRYAVDGLLVDGLTVLGGRPKQGKSWLSLLIAWAVASGYDLDGRLVQPGKVLYLALEDTERRLKKRLQTLNTAFGWEPPAGLTFRTHSPRGDDGGLYHIGEWVKEQGGTAQLVVVDTLAKFRPRQKGNSNGYADDYEAVGSLQQLCAELGVAGLVNHHTRKLRAEDPFDELSGTLGISGAADSLWVLERERGHAAAKLFLTGRDLPEGTIPLTFNPADCRWKVGATREGIDTAGRTASPETGKLEQCMGWLKQLLKDYAYPSAEIEAAGVKAGFTPRTIRDAKKELGRNGTGELTHRKIGFGEGVWWSGLTAAEWKTRPLSAGSSHTSGENGRMATPSEESLED